MRAFRLLGAALQAESLLLRAEARARTRSALGLGVASVFALTALGLLHAAAWLSLAPRVGVIEALLILAAADALAMLAIGLAFRPRPDPVAEEALRLRRQSLDAFRELSPLREALSLIPWRSPAYVAGGRLAERLARWVTRGRRPGD